MIRRLKVVYELEIDDVYVCDDTDEVMTPDKYDFEEFCRDVVRCKDFGVENLVSVTLDGNEFSM